MEERLSHYRMLRKLGEGGMGRVYLAEDTRLHRRVALKLLSPAMAGDADWLARFREEARAAAALSHPNIVTLYSIDESDGRHFLTMELVEGRTLRRWARASRPSPERLIELATRLAEALAAAHAKGIVHRDLKPSNIMVTSDGQPKILDFGLAKRRSPGPVGVNENSRTALLTRPGTVVGTLRYLSPEQARGEEAGPESDLFALGIILYELATGRLPFAGKSSAETLAALLRDSPPPVRDLNPEIPPALASTIHDCLERDRNRRIRSARELLRRLREAAQSGSVAAVATPERRSIAVLPFADLSAAGDQEYFCDGLADELIGALGRLPELRVVARSSAFRFKNRSLDARTIGERLGVSSVLEGSVRKSGSRVRISIQLVNVTEDSQIWADAFDRELAEIFEIQEDIARRVVEALELRLASPTPARVAPAARNLEAYNHYLRGRYAWNKRTGVALEESVERFRQAIEAEPLFAPAHAGLADAYALLGIYGDLSPDTVMPRAESSARRALDLDPHLAAAHASLGYVLSVYRWRWSEAEESFLRAIEVEPGYATAHHWYAIVNLVPRGRFDDALERLERATRLDPLSPAIAVSVGLVHYFGRRFDLAADRIGEALRLEDRFAFGHLALGWVQAETGDAAAAIASIERALELSGGDAEQEAARGYALARAGRVAEAEAVLERLLERRTGGYVAPSIVAQVSAGLDRADEALDLLEEAAVCRASDLAWVAHRPIFDGLRPHPRFRALIDQVGVG